VGKKSERILWKKGFTTWEVYDASFHRQPSLFSGFSIYTPLRESMEAYEKEDMAYFANTLPSAEYYRVALEFPQDVLFLDIETTGLSLYYDIISIVGWSIGKEYGVYINGQDDAPLREALAHAKVIVTFNGTLFDLKFLKKYLDNPPIPPVHLDLRFFAKRVGLSGGQKAIEKEIGFARESDVEGMLGEAAPILWHQYRRGDKDAMKRLIEYNHADIEGMKWILDTSTELYFEKESIPKKIRKKPKFAKQSSLVKWANKNSSKFNSSKIYIPEFSGSNEPLITYAQLTELHPLDDFCAIGIDLVSSEERETGFCILRGRDAKTCRVKTDEEMIRLAIEARADLISIDSPLSIPKGRTTFFDDDPHRDEFGITRECERILKRRGISSYPCLIPSMQKLTQRGMLLAQKFRKLGIPVIESYPGAAQDIMSIPRKQAGLDYLVEGLKEFGLTGEFIDTPVSHDELDAITSAVVGHFFWVGMYEGLGNPEEEYLIIPDLNASYKKWLSRKVVGLSGPIASGKTTVAEYLANHGYTYVRYSQVLKNMLEKKGEDSSRTALQNIGWSIHEEKGQRWLGKKVIDLLTGKKYAVVDGLHFLEDHALMVETFGPAFHHFHIRTTDDSEREMRVTIRKLADITLVSATSHLVEKEINLLERVADHVIHNDGTIENLYVKCDKILKN
jgi:uncharacterized protein YprB with RNaseH-like and TPR domain/predicted nuclease with RNAse H fold/dephospho-CoA kinase